MLRTYQSEDVEYLKPHDRVAILSEQRTGKTPISLTLAREWGFEKCVIVTTSSTLFQWKAECEKWLGETPMVVYGNVKQKQNLLDKPGKIIIISYSTIKRPEYMEYFLYKYARPDILILDECHHMRNTKTETYKQLIKLSKRAHKLILMTGTPCYNKQTDIYPILQMLYPMEFTSLYKFYHKHCTPKQVYTPRGIVTQFDDISPESLPYIQSIINERAVNRKRKEVMQWLPKIEVELLKLPPTQNQLKYLEQLKKTFRTDKGEVECPSVVSRLIRYRQICLDPKLLELKGESPKVQFILSFIEENPRTPVLIFSNFTSFLKKLYAEIKSPKALISGDTSPEYRAELVEDYQAGKYNVLLLNTIAAKEGLTLDRAEVEIFTDYFPPIGAVEQAEARFIATTPTRAEIPKRIIRLVIEGTYDENIIALLEKRADETEVINNFKEVMNGKSDIPV